MLSRLSNWEGVKKVSFVYALEAKINLVYIYIYIYNMRERERPKEVSKFLNKQYGNCNF